MGISRKYGVIDTNCITFKHVNISFCPHKPHVCKLNGIFDFDIFVNCQLTMKYYNEISTFVYGHRKLSDAEEMASLLS